MKEDDCWLDQLVISVNIYLIKCVFCIALEEGQILLYSLVEEAAVKTYLLTV